MNKILITGATGFLGSHILKRILADTDYNILVLKRSFSKTARIEQELTNPRVKFYDTDKTDLSVIFKENIIETIIHCATSYGRKNESITDIVEANLLMPLKLLQLALSCGACKNFINTDTMIEKNTNGYSLSKKHFTEWLVLNSDKIKSVNLTLEHFYGPFDNSTKFTTFIIRSMITNADKLDLTEGMQKRYFIYIDDVTDAFMRVLKNFDKISSGFTEFQLSTEKNVTIKDFVLLVKKLTGNKNTKLNFGAIPYRKNELMDFKTDISGLMKLGWRPRVSLEEGLKRTILEESGT